MKKILLFLLLTNYAYSQDKTGFAIDPYENNVAALFTMTNEQGRTKNLELMEGIFADGSLGFKSQKYHNVSANFIYGKLSELSSGLDEGATLLLYFNSHGGGSGDKFGMTSSSGSFKFSKALESLGKSKKKIKRLIILVDTCHAEGSIQDSLKQDGELLKNIKSAKPTNYLPELSSNYNKKELPFISIFLNNKSVDGRGMVSVVDFGENSGIYEEILIISSSSVEDLSIRGAFASRLAGTFEKIKKNKEITVGEFLKIFAESHYNTGQQPHYKILPEDSMFSELLFAPPVARLIPINSKENLPNDFIPMPRSK
jgi:hypothetical protein